MQPLLFTAHMGLYIEAKENPGGKNEGLLVSGLTVFDDNAPKIGQALDLRVPPTQFPEGVTLFYPREQMDLLPSIPEANMINIRTASVFAQNAAGIRIETASVTVTHNTNTQEDETIITTPSRALTQALHTMCESHGPDRKMTFYPDPVVDPAAAVLNLKVDGQPYTSADEFIVSGRVLFRTEEVITI
jgi:hypothetical protein